MIQKCRETASGCVGVERPSGTFRLTSVKPRVTVLESNYIVSEYGWRESIMLPT